MLEIIQNDPPDFVRRLSQYFCTRLKREKENPREDAEAQRTATSLPLLPAPLREICSFYLTRFAARNPAALILHPRT
jgi:hypothetical protein